MADLSAFGSIDPKTGNVTVPEMDPLVVSEFNGYVRGQGDADTSDELFDMSLEFVMFHKTAGPYSALDKLEGTDEYYALEDEALELGREWAYALMEGIGRPYTAGNPAKSKIKRRLMRS